MGRVYTVVFDNVSVTPSSPTTTAPQDLFEISPADDKPCKVLGWVISQISDVGDAQEEMLRYSIRRGYSTSGSGGSAPTPRPCNPSDTAAAFAAEVNNTTLASAGTATTLYNDAFNIRTGTQVFLPPNMQPIVSQGSGQILVFRLDSSPSDSLTLSGTLWVEEEG